MSKSKQIGIASKNGGDTQPCLTTQAKKDPMGNKNKTGSLARVSKNISPQILQPIVRTYMIQILIIMTFHLIMV